MNKFGNIAFLLFEIFFANYIFAYEAEEMDGFPKGPVSEVVKTLISKNGESRIAARMTFNKKGQLIEALEGNQETGLSGKFKWSKSGNCEEAVFYRGDSFLYKLIQKYDDSPDISTHYITWMESDMLFTFHKYKHAGNLIDHRKYDANDKLIYREE